MAVNRRLRLWVLRWHRRTGLLAVFFVLMLVITGIALNHTESLSLDERRVSNQVLLNAYGMELPPLKSFAVGDAQLSQIAGQDLYLDKTRIGFCDAPLHGAVALPAASLSGAGGAPSVTAGWLVALCGEQLWLLEADGNVIERIGRDFGLPEGVSQLGLYGRQLVLGGAENYRVDLEQLQFQRFDTEQAISWVEPVALPQRLQGLRREHSAAGPSWERVILDLHSGRLFGNWGVYLVDAMAILFLAIALGGVWVWFTKPGRFRKP